MKAHIKNMKTSEKSESDQILLSNCDFLNVGLDAFPFMVSILPPSFYFALFVLYFLENRQAGYIPTISETGTENPNICLMVSFFCCIAASVYYVMRSLSLLIDFYHPNIIEYFLL